jgi:hypothetical protein
MASTDNNGRYAVGYRKPPRHRRFTKGQSGNHGGRPRGMTTGRATALALKELYRPVHVKEGDKVTRMPAIQAVLRSQVNIAAKGNTAAQRALFEIAYAIEKALATQFLARKADEPISDIEAARRIAAALRKLAPDKGV